MALLMMLNIIHSPDPNRRHLGLDRVVERVRPAASSDDGDQETHLISDTYEASKHFCPSYHILGQKPVIIRRRVQKEHENFSMMRSVPQRRLKLAYPV
jgi:hypothetical protein